jgi:IMP dehydrogenase
VTGDYFKRADLLLASGASALCIDVAHGHHILVKEVLEELRATHGEGLCIIAGNVATKQGINDLADWGANAVRCNIGGGSICSTRIQTGHGVPGLETILQCYQTDRNVAIIADGGLRNSGDIVKAIAAGADCVMLGSLLSGTDETPGDFVYVNGEKRKAYRGMASPEAQFDWRGRAGSLEGVSATVPYKGSADLILTNLAQGLRSGMSYSGARTLKELQHRAQFIKQSSAGATESGTHIHTNR